MNKIRNYTCNDLEHNAYTCIYGISYFKAEGYIEQDTNKFEWIVEQIDCYALRE